MDDFFGLFRLGEVVQCCTCNRREDADADEMKLKDVSDDKKLVRRGISGAKPKLGGVGIVFKGTESGGLVVSLLAKGGPAEASGEVEEGDSLVSIDGVPIAGMSDQDLAKRLLGPLGKEVTLGLERILEGGKATIVRATLIRSLTDAQRNAQLPEQKTPWDMAAKAPTQHSSVPPHNDAPGSTI
eukprot:CAMPEP_0180143328 /NCGR_PEP_ID=MMETSP0986-20121125/16196_1 /TAXON_ID=697907 /ORGANISM="non described non described, Strain CCMP2293" /LENGTH=183 /DNA_ID=CAMNT_0022086867 /DNA_START=77 /DNA_END=628 /DNA_ORIENTATION=-